MASVHYLALLTTLASWTLAHASAIPFPNGYHGYTPRSDHLKWENCSVDSYPGRECTQFEAPLDWHDEAAGRASLAVIRYPAIKSPRLGTLFMNPGGPGESGVGVVQGSLGDQIMQASGGQYDVVSWDPRGVGESTPRTNCFGTTEEELAFWSGSFIRTGLEARGNFTSQTDLDEFYEQLDEADDLLKRFGKQCVEYNPNALQYVGTAATVRDMVAIHDVLEGSDGAINYWGVSYGTIIGITFVNMFPDRVGRVVIDGVVDPNYWADRPAYQIYEVDFESSDEAFNGFAAACAKAGPSRCAIAEHNSTQASVSQWVRDLIDALYSPTAWSDLAQTLKDMADGLNDPTSLNTTITKRWISNPILPLDDLNKRNVNNDSDIPKTYAYATEAITCADAQDVGDTTTKDVFDFIVKVTREVTHMFGPVSTKIAGTYCHHWPVRAVERYTGPWNKKLSNPILVIGNEADPITPYINAKNVADALGDSAVLIEQDDFGHASLAMHSNCTISALERYFVHNKLPHKDEFCGTNQELFPKTGITKSTLREL